MSVIAKCSKVSNSFIGNLFIVSTKNCSQFCLNDNNYSLLRIVTISSLTPAHGSYEYGGITDVDCSSNEGSTMMCSYSRTAGDTCIGRQLTVLECTSGTNQQ